MHFSQFCPSLVLFSGVIGLGTLMHDTPLPPNGVSDWLLRPSAVNPVIPYFFSFLIVFTLYFMWSLYCQLRVSGALHVRL